MKTTSFITCVQFELMNDHKPLIPILEHYLLSQIKNKQLQQLKEKINHLKLNVTWVPGKEGVEADALSRYPTAKPTPDDIMDEDYTINFTSINTIQTIFDFGDLADETDRSTNHLLLSKLKDLTANDKEYQELLKLIQEGFPTLPNSLRFKMGLYWQDHEELYINQAGFICHNNCLLIP